MHYSSATPCQIINLRLSAGEGHSQAGAEQDVVLLEPRKGITQQAVAHRELPAEPLPEGGHGRGVEIHSVVADAAYIREEDEAFGHGGARRELVRKLFSDQGLAVSLIGIVGEELAIQ